MAVGRELSPIQKRNEETVSGTVSAGRAASEPISGAVDQRNPAIDYVPRKLDRQVDYRHDPLTQNSGNVSGHQRIPEPKTVGDRFSHGIYLTRRDRKQVPS